jgi:hypothetical protein
MAHKIYVDNVTVIDAATMNDVDAVVYTNSKLVTDIHTAPPKATPVDADELGIWNSVGSVLGKVTFSNLWLWIAAYTGNVTNKTFTTGNAFNGTLGATTPAAVTATTITATTTNSALNGTLGATTPAAVTATTVTATTASGLLDLKTNTALADAAATLTAAQLRGGEFTITPTVARILTLDTAANIIANLTGSVDNSNYEITIVNLAAFDVTLATGVGVTIVGRAVINNGSATFRVRRLTSTTVEVKRLEGAAVLGVLHVRDERASGTHGGGISATTWTVIPVSTIVSNSILGASLASNQITLPPGSYRITAGSTIHIDAAVARKFRVRNVTGGVTVALSQSAYLAGSNTSIVGTTGDLITVSVTSTFELQYWAGAAQATYGLGVAASSGELEVYAVAHITKVA